MNKLKMKTTATLLIAIFMISALAIAIPVMSVNMYDYGFQIQEPGADVYLSTEQAHEGAQSVKQVIEGGTADTDARVYFNYYDTLDSLDSVDFWAYLDAQENPSNVGPYVSMSVDTTGEGDADAWIVQGSQYYVLDTWEGFHGLDADTQVAVTISQVGGIPWEVPYGTFSDLKTTSLAGDGKTWGECTVLEVKVGIGTWGPGYDATAFVDDVSINGELPCGFELDDPVPAGFPMETNTLYPEVSFTLTPPGVTFANVVAGTGEVSTTIDIKNTGQIAETFTVELAYDPDDFYTSYLSIDANGYKYPFGGWGITIPHLGADVPVLLRLNVPLDAPIGTFKGTLLFIAEASG